MVSIFYVWKCFKDGGVGIDVLYFALLYELRCMYSVFNVEDNGGGGDLGNNVRSLVWEVDLLIFYFANSLE